VSVGAEGGEDVGQVGRRLDHLGHHQQLAPGARVGLMPGAQVLAALREVREWIGPGDLVGVDRRVRNPVIDQGVAQRGEGDGLARPGRTGQQDDEHGASVAAFTPSPVSRGPYWCRIWRLKGPAVLARGPIS